MLYSCSVFVCSRSTRGCALAAAASRHVGSAELRFVCNNNSIPNGIELYVMQRNSATARRAAIICIWPYKASADATTLTRLQCRVQQRRYAYDVYSFWGPRQDMRSAAVWVMRRRCLLEFLEVSLQSRRLRHYCMRPTSLCGLCARHFGNVERLRQEE